MLIRMNEDNVNTDDVRRIADCLRDGGVIIYPTDTVYAMGCDIMHARAVEKVCKLKGIRAEKANFSFVCSDLGHLAAYTRPISNQVFRIMKKALPGPFTFILEANTEVPKLLKQNKKTVGIRVPDNNICRAIIRELGHPIMSTSLHDDSDEIVDYFADPSAIYERYEKEVDMVIDGGFGNIYPSTVIDCSHGEPVVVREGLGSLDVLA